MSLSILIPIYNAENLIPRAVPALRSFLRSLSSPYEIVFCDDGSSDRSGALLEDICRRDPSVRHLRNPGNRGLGHTLRTLFREARGDVLVYLDIDLPFGVDIIATMLDVIRREGADVVVVSRYADVPARVPFARKAASRMYYLLCRLLFNIPVRDIGSGTVAVRKTALAGIVLKADGFDCHAEFYAAMARAGRRIREIPGDYQDPGGGSFSIRRHGWAVVRDTLRLRRERASGAPGRNSAS